MKTIPFLPVLENPTFFNLEPAAKYYCLELIILLGKHRKLALPLPSNLKPYVTCSKSHYRRFIAVYEQILTETVPEIYKIKTVYNRQGYRPSKQHSINAAKKRLDKNKNNTFSDEMSMHMPVFAVPSPPKQTLIQAVPPSKPYSMNQKPAQSNKSGEEVWLKDD